MGDSEEISSSVAGLLSDDDHDNDYDNNNEQRRQTLRDNN
jgi:hypothetical protein